MKITGNGPVHPTIKHQKYQFENNPPRFVWETAPGLTIRQHFAIMVLQGICSCVEINQVSSLEKMAELSVKQADALIAELNKPTT